MRDESPERLNKLFPVTQLKGHFLCETFADIPRQSSLFSWCPHTTLHQLSHLPCRVVNRLLCASLAQHPVTQSSEPGTDRARGGLGKHAEGVNKLGNRHLPSWPHRTSASTTSITHPSFFILQSSSCKGSLAWNKRRWPPR